MYFLGIDTSCYTTSCAVVNAEGKLVKSARKLLEVPAGSRGVAQSNMVFQHTRALPSLVASLPLTEPLAAVGVSAFPRREEGSYMPAFLVGKGAAENIAHFTKVPVFNFSHQENHVLAALCESGEAIPEEDFFALHVSGGTTELLHCQPNSSYSFTSKIIGHSLDLHAGQFVDRVGVALGLSFPAGPALENLAKDTVEYRALPFSVKGGMVSYSGPGSEALRRIEKQQERPESLALSVFNCLSRSLTAMIQYHLKEHKVKKLIAVGGVMSNLFLRSALENLSKENDISLLLASPTYSSDNATGVAYGAYLRFMAK